MRDNTIVGGASNAYDAVELVMNHYEKHLEEVRKIFEIAISKNMLSIALRAKILEVKIQQDQKKSAKDDGKIKIHDMSEDEIDAMLDELKKA